MDPSLSQLTEKNEGRPKKIKKDKKGKKEKKEKKEEKKQTVSIDLTSPARAYTQREEAKPASVSSNKHTYNSRPLPLFSSNDSTGPPSTGTNAVRSRAKSAAAAVAVPDHPRTNDTERSTYSHGCKIKALEICLSLKDSYLAMPPAVQTDQEPFWTQVRDSLERKPIARGKFKDWQAVQRGIESWCQPRRSSMREERLSAVSQSHPELDELVDQWNLIFAQRFCKIHMGYFTAALRERNNATILPSRAVPPGLQRSSSSLGPTQLELTQQGPTPRGTPPLFSLQARPAEKNGEKSSKRKDLDPPTRGGVSASSHDQSKRPRLDNHSSDSHPASSFALSGRDNHSARTPSSRQPRPRSPQRPKTSYGPIETQGHRSRGNDRMPPMTPCPTGPGPTTEPRTDGLRRPDGRRVPGDYYRPDYMSRRSN